MRRYIVGTAGALVALAVQTALAQTTATSADTGKPTDSDQLQEVVVTAEKRPEDLQKTAISIQATSGEELRQEGKKRLDEIMDDVVGVQSQGSQVGVTFYMRGLGTTGGQNAVAVLVDGIYQDRSETVRGGTLDMAQAEVMRGTQSTNLGAYSLAGAVSLVSNQPVFSYQANGSLELGNYHLMSTEGVLNIPFADNQALRFAYSTDNRNGYISAGAGDSDLQNARIKYRWQPTEDLNIVLTDSHQHIGGDGIDDGVLLYTGHWVPYSTSIAAGTANGTYIESQGGAPLTMGYPPIFGAVNDGITYKDRSNPWDDGYPDNIWPNDPFRDTVIDIWSSDITYQMPFGTLTVMPSMEKALFRSEEPPRGGSYREQNQPQQTEQFEARLSSNSDSKVTWLLGTYYYHTNETGTFLGVGLPGNSGGQGCATNATTDDYCWQNTPSSWSRTYSMYGNFTYPFTPALRLVGGLRYSKDYAGFKESGDVDGNASEPLSAYTYYYGRASWQGLTYRTGLEYDIVPESMAYAVVSSGYQPGTVHLNGNAPQVNPKQTLVQYTLGIKNRFFNDKLQVNAELFHSLYHNQSLQGSIVATDTNANGAGNASTDSTCGPAPGNSAAISEYGNCATLSSVVIPNLTSQGVDLETTWLPSASDRVDFSIEYLQSTIGTPSVTETGAELEALATTEGYTVSAADAATLANLLQANAKTYNGLTLENSPKWSLNATYQHSFHLPGGSQLIPKLNAIYKTKYWSAGGPNADIENTSGPSWQQAYSLFNVYTTWQSQNGKFDVTAYMKNISDYPVMTDYGGTYVTLDAPRTWGIIFSASL